MKITKLRTALSAIAALILFVPSTRSEQSIPAATLRKTTLFALGGIGEAGTMSEGERALREVLKESDVPARLEKLVSDASPAGQLYALLGLRLRDRAAYERALAKLRTTDAKVQTARGCILQQESFGDLVKEIERGQYDNFLAREWPKNAR
ncbi:MAG: hypothetical protein DME97_02945 [Verrucomicrobia bacterium]|nr:MAG: hypothetical protein DME97_02945 [Verrucomicrobiota bacterium]